MILVFLSKKKIKFSKLPHLISSAVEQENPLSWCFYFAVSCFLVARVCIWLNLLWLLKVESPELRFICKVWATKSRVKQSPEKTSGYVKPHAKFLKCKACEKTGHKSLCLQKRKSPVFIIYAPFWWARKEAPCRDKCCNYSDNTLGAAASSVGHGQESITASSCCASTWEGEHLSHSGFFLNGKICINHRKKTPN